MRQRLHRQANRSRAPEIDQVLDVHVRSAVIVPRGQLRTDIRRHKPPAPRKCTAKRQRLHLCTARASSVDKATA